MRPSVLISGRGWKISHRQLCAVGAPTCCVLPSLYTEAVQAFAAQVISRLPKAWLIVHLSLARGIFETWGLSSYVLFD